METLLSSRALVRLAFLALVVVSVTSARADGDAPEPVGTSAPAGAEVVEAPSAEEVEDVLPAGGALGGRELYDRFLKNKRHLRTAHQRGRILSADPGGHPQKTEFWLQWKDYRDVNDDAVDGVYTKAVFRVAGPYEMRHTSYLYVERSDREDEQFMYSPHRQRTSRVKIKGMNVAGTDFSFDDFLVSLDDIEDADYRRHDDEVLQGVSCYVVEAIMKPEARSGYSRSIAYLEKEHYVPLRTRYWDEVGVEVKEIVSPHAKIEEFDGAWVPTESVGTDLLEETHSTMHVDVLEPNPDLADEIFSVSRLALGP